MKAKFPEIPPIPGWLFLITMSLYVELTLFFWTADAFVAGRLAAIVVFGLAFGCALGFLTSLLSPKWEKRAAVVLSFLLGVFCLVEYFIHDAFQVFMPLVSVFATAEGVATGYAGTVLVLVLKNLWRIALVLLPVILFALSPRCTGGSWKRTLALGLAAAALYGGGVTLVHSVGLDTAQFSAAANFDGTVSSFGLSMGTVMDLSGGAAVGDSGTEFEIPETIQPSTEAIQPSTEASQESTAPTEAPVVYNPQAFDLDFGALAESESSYHIANIHRYVASLQPDMENEYTGLFAGKNLILITAEAFSGKVLDPELTPTLWRMANEGIQFTDYYHPVWGCGTTGGEFANLLSLVPFNGTAVMMETVEQDMFLTMGNQLQKLGYASAAFHNNDHTYYKRHLTHTELGYDQFIACGTGMEKLISKGWPRSDSEMFDMTIPEYLDQPPFSLYYMTVSGHSPYSEGNAMVVKNYNYVKDLPWSEPVKCYLAANLDLEFAMACVIRRLEEAGIADDTVIVISTDHYPYGLAPSDTWGGKDCLAELYGSDWNNDLIRDQSCLIIWSGCLEDMDIVVNDPVSSLDILPTLSNLFGLPYDSRLMVGRDVFSSSEPLVFWPLSYSWKTDKGIYDARTGEFTPAQGLEVPEGYVETIAAKVRNKIRFSSSVQEYDYYDVISNLLNPVEIPE